MVYVLDQEGRPLMPTNRHGKVKHLLREGKAKVVKRTPFTIQLLYESTHYTQDIILGVDAGSKTIGMSAATEKQEVFAAEVTPRNDIVKLMSERRSLRRARRNRKTRYRPVRFNNRVKSKHKGWLAPSIEVKIQEHITSIKRVLHLLPITKVIVETAEFNLQLLKAIENGDPLPEGTDYQKGEQLGHYNLRQYILHRDDYTCQACGEHKEGTKLHVHHLESRRVGGNAPDNLVTLCETCHKALHQGLITEDDLKKRKRRSTRDATFMGIMRKTLMTRLRNALTIAVAETRGYFTKYTRVEVLQLPKSHINDAFAICQGSIGFKASKETQANRIEEHYLIKPVRHHNRKLHKLTILKGGIRKSNQSDRYTKGYRLYDKVLFNGQECFIFGRRTSGYFDLRKLDGTKVHASASWKKLTLLERQSNYLIERKVAG